MLLLASVLDDERLSRAELSRGAYCLLELALREGYGLEHVEIRRFPGGKPVLAGETGLHFSISHSWNTVCVGVSKCPIGVDIERLRPYNENHARRLFPAEMLDAFGYFGGWTLRESTFKLLGDGGLMSMKLSPRADGLAELAGRAVCRGYENLPGFACAAAAEDESGLPERLELVKASLFL